MLSVLSEVILQRYFFTLILVNEPSTHSAIPLSDTAEDRLYLLCLAEFEHNRCANVEVIFPVMRTNVFRNYDFVLSKLETNSLHWV